MAHQVWQQMGDHIKLWGIITTSLYGLTFLAPSTLAQVKPDNTLGANGSRVTAIDQFNQRIDGGVTRGTNLFHSFQEFNIGEGRGVYFANPVRIENILSRVTGNNPSNIFGTLGVLGKANLYLLNPKGIVFGPSASLDIQGSFHGTTASSIALGKRGHFSATAPQRSQLLSVSPNANFLTQASHHVGSIVNQGQLVTGQDLSLTAGQLDLQGQISASRNLTLQASDSIKIRDSIASPFIAVAGDRLLVQGNQTVDIFALNHPESGFFSGGNMVLRSTNPVGGDAHYTSGGNFSIESLSGQPGNLFSPYDPIIRALGDVEFNGYAGSSLHIIAAGSVDIDTIFITDIETGFSDIDFIQQAIKLSDGNVVNIDGRAQATIDIRAGVNSEGVFASSVTGISSVTDFFAFFPGVPPITGVPTSADINIQTIIIGPPRGLVYLTNQYKPNLNLAGGNITISGSGSGGINTTATIGNGGQVILDARRNIELEGTSIDTTALIGNSGNITLLANQDIRISDGSLLTVVGLEGNSGQVNIQANGNFLLENSNIFSVVDGFGNSNDISLKASSIIIRRNSELATNSFGSGSVGQIKLQADKSISINDSIIQNSIGLQGTGSSNDIELIARAIDIKNSTLQTTTFGQGDAGKVSIKADEDVSLSQTLISSTVGEPAIGNSNGIDIAANSINISSGSTLATSTFGQGDAGNIRITSSKEFTLIDGSQIRSITSGLGSGGDVTIIAKEGVLFDGNQASTAPTKTSGILTVNLSPVLGNRLQDDPSGGNISIQAKSLSLINGAQLNTSTAGQGNAGNVSLDIEDSINLFDGFIFSTAESVSVGKGGTIDIQAKSLTLDKESRITTSTFSPLKIVSPSLGSFNSKAGDIFINTNDFVSLDRGSGILSSVGPGGIGSSGNIKIDTSSLSLRSGSQIQALLFREQAGLPGGQGTGGAIDINAQDSVTVSGASSTGFSSGLLVLSERGAFGSAGDITITTNNFLVSDGAVVAAGIFNDGGPGGNISITANTFQALNGGQVLTNTRSTQNAGSIKLSINNSIVIDGIDVNFADRLKFVEQQIQRLGASEKLTDVVINEGPNSGLFANTAPLSTGKGGNIIIDPITTVLQNGGTIAVDSQGSGQGGDIHLQSGSLFLNNQAEIRASSLGIGNSGSISLTIDGLLSSTDSSITTAAEQASGGEINISAGDIRLNGDSDILTSVALGTGDGGNITLTANTILAFGDSDILAFADPQQGQGGNITLNTPVFFGENFFGVTSEQSLRSREALNLLEANNRVDLNATGQTSGIVSIPDVSFIQNNLTELPENLINTENLLANSCIVRTANEQGKFIITGPGGLPTRPGDASKSSFSTGSVQTIPREDTSSESNDTKPWEIGDPIVEPQGTYSLGNGRLVLSRECAEAE